MKRIDVIIAMAKDGGYNVYCKNEMFSGMGDTIEDAKADLIAQIKFFKEAAIEDKTEYPEFLDTEYEFVYHTDIASVLDYFNSIISLNGLSKITGINKNQICRYMHRKAKPRETQVVKIENALHRLGSELQSISL